MPSPFRIEVGEKYALISISCNIKNEMPDEWEIEPGLWVKRSLPFEISEHWREWLGSFRIEAIDDAKIFLISKGPSRNPESLDAENEKYLGKIRYLFWGLVLSDFFAINGFPYQFSGANVNGEIDIRRVVEDIEKPIPTQGSPDYEIEENHLRTAIKITNALRQLEERKKKYFRFFESLRAFWNGIQNKRVSEKIHQFVRCIEGFILPDKGSTTKQFILRSELFLGKRSHEFSRRLYDTRCIIEHLNDPFKYYKKENIKKREIALNKIAIQSEALARYCILRFLFNKKLWFHFQDDSHLAKFWKLPREKQIFIWGDSFDIKNFLGKLN